MDILEQAIKQLEYMKQIRETIHQNPELGDQEVETSALVQRELEQLGIPYRAHVAKTGVVGLLQGSRTDGPTILLRADMDALPIQELNQCPYRSKKDNVMHACGHDVHTAMLLGAAKILSACKGDLDGTVKLCFQPAEEAAAGGAELMVKEGLLEDPKVDFALALHVEPQYRVGSAGIQPGAITACPDFFSITFHGKGGHGSLPHLTKDPIQPAVDACVQIRGLRSRVDPLEPCVIQVCMIHGGTAQAVIPDECTLQGTVRVFQKEHRELIREGLASIAKNIAETYGMKYDYNYRGRCFSIVNDEAFVRQIRKSTEEIFPLGVMKNKDMGGDDFCFISDQVPSVYIPIGSSNEDPATQYPVHSPHFEIDDMVLCRGAATLAKVAYDLLTGANQE